MRKGFHEPAEKPRRFYKSVEAVEDDGGFGIALDSRRLRTPKGLPLVLPTRALADEIAGEWAAQGETIEMAQMHATRLANTAIESVPQAREATADSVANFAGSDLLCYFAEDPQSLLQRQQAAWEPVLQRAEAELGLSFVRAAGIVHQAQPEASIEKVRALATSLDDFALAGLAFCVALYGSAVLGLAVQRGWLTGEEAFDLSRLDETFQEEKWGVDEEAAERTARMRIEAQMLDRWFKALVAA
ncbi:ATP12 family chaperone protein [Phenylobacterium sp.]|jgi:chaperone required for assembly of F1-ATPase|uniref:ATP12 family chaperone protein n=1 Tax=Phenylobacterium sp. TaxID=1871053 RepID=UPI002F91C86F